MSNIQLSEVEEQIYECLNLDKPQSFFLYAGAGSGKTRSLVQVLSKFKQQRNNGLKLRAKKVAIITYTNAACDEIKERLDFDPSFHISTIHSFAWELIQTHVRDIKEYLRNNLQIDIGDLKDSQNKRKNKNTKIYIKTEEEINTNEKRLKELDEIKKFSYSPTGENTGVDALSHAEVIKITSYFLKNKTMMQKILVQKYPILLIDESQDTNKDLIDALFIVQNKVKCPFLLGLFGDTMQRIYMDGKHDLADKIPSEWNKPELKTNYRCPKRVVKLINKIRDRARFKLTEQFFNELLKVAVPANVINQLKSIKDQVFEGEFKFIQAVKDVIGEEETVRYKVLILKHARDGVDNHKQEANKEIDGFVRVFIVGGDKTSQKEQTENEIKEKMSSITDDIKWSGKDSEVKTLILEHHMAAVRMGFKDFFEPLYNHKEIKPYILDGSHPLIEFIGNLILPLYDAYKKNDQFMIAKIIRTKTELLSRKKLEEIRKNNIDKGSKNALKEIKDKTSLLFELWDTAAEPTLINILELILKKKIFDVPASIKPIIKSLFNENNSTETNNNEEGEEIKAWQSALNVPMSVFKKYHQYITDESIFGTHQGVKGLQFPRVMIIIDDSEAKGFLFSYDKLFGVKEPSETDRKNMKTGNDSSISRTKRLFYVICSRAEESLAIVLYSQNPGVLRENLVNSEWFSEEEIVEIK